MTKPKIIHKIRKKKPLADKSRYYIDKEEYAKELIKFKKNGVASHELAVMFRMHIDQMGSGSGFKNYTYLEEMKSDAVIFLLSYAKNFDPSISRNGFSYCTSIIYNAFIQAIGREKKQSYIKDCLIKNQKRSQGSPPRSSVFDTLNFD